jgi:hypothetical protein
MTTLQNRWYNGLVTELLLDPATFQISQPSPPVTPSDQGLWAYENVIPPASLTFNHSLFTGDPFFDEYAAVIDLLEFPESSFEQDIGEKTYQEWSEYLNQLSPPPPQNRLPALFREWAMKNAPDVMAVGASKLAQIILINSFQKAVEPYQGPTAKPVDFIGTYADLLQVLGNSSGNRLSFDSSKTSDDVGETWTGGKDVDLHGLWTGSSPNHRLSCRFAESKVTVSARFKAYTVWTSTPGPWYNSGLLQMAYSSRTTPPWPQEADPTWDDVFGPDGRMLRFIASLVVVDSVSSTVASDAIYEKSDQQTILSNAPKGLWPFYTPTKSGDVTNEVTFDRASGMKIETVTQSGNLLVLGANVLGIAQYLGHRTA